MHMVRLHDDESIAALPFVLHYLLVVPRTDDSLLGLQLVRHVLQSGHQGRRFGKGNVRRSGFLAIVCLAASYVGKVSLGGGADWVAPPPVLIGTLAVQVRRVGLATGYTMHHSLQTIINFYCF